jgi:hypothetical protein
MSLSHLAQHRKMPGRMTETHTRSFGGSCCITLLIGSTETSTKYTITCANCTCATCSFHPNPAIPFDSTKEPKHYNIKINNPGNCNSEHQAPGTCSGYPACHSIPRACRTTKTDTWSVLTAAAAALLGAPRQPTCDSTRTYHLEH